MLTQLSLRAVLMVLVVVVTQVAGASMLVKTNGFRVPLWTVACLATYAVSFFVLAETIRQGMALSFVMPVLAALVPIVTIIVAMVLFREEVSWLQFGILSVACVLIGVAAAV